MNYNQIHDKLIIDVYNGNFNKNNIGHIAQLNKTINYLVKIANNKDKRRFIMTLSGERICLFKMLFDINAFNHLEFILDNGFKDLSFIDLNKLFMIEGELGERIVEKYGKMLENYYDSFDIKSEIKMVKRKFNNKRSNRSFDSEETERSKYVKRSRT